MVWCNDDEENCRIGFALARLLGASAAAPLAAYRFAWAHACHRCLFYWLPGGHAISGCKRAETNGRGKKRTQQQQRALFFNC